MRLFGRRKARRLSPAREKLMQEFLPQIAIDKDTPLTNFGTNDMVLEIGFGAGEHLAQLAKDNPNCDFIGCEVFVNGIASLLSHIKANNLKNIRIFNDDARHLIPLISDNMLSSIYLLFPDPWHKARHAKRRLLQPNNVNEFARILKPNGTLKIASDNPLYVRHALTCLTNSKYFTWNATQPKHWQNPPKNHTQTRYEQKAKQKNKPITYLNFTRTSTPPK